MNTTNNTTKNLEDVKDQALLLMKNAGYEITSSVSVLIDKSLPFMGYTTEQNGKPLIVVSEDAMKGGMALNLLVHELSHVYRFQSKHPSHNYHLVTAITNWVAQGRVVTQYQNDILQGIINHLQDIYADDISFQIFTTTAPSQDLNAFFLTWIHEPSKATELNQRSWENAGNLLSAAFAAANLERHSITDKDGIVAKSITDFLKKLGKGREDTFYFFKEFMIRLPEKVTDKEFEKLLIPYLSEFFKLIKSF